MDNVNEERADALAIKHAEELATYGKSIAIDIMNATSLMVMAMAKLSHAHAGIAIRHCQEMHAAYQDHMAQKIRNN